MRILYDDQWSLGSLSPSSELGNFPATATQDVIATNTWATAGASAQITLDAGSPITVDAIAIVNHNVSAAATVIRLEANSVDDFTSPPFSEDITHRAEIMLKFFTSDTFRYWRLTVTDTTNPDGSVRIGRIMLAPRLEMAVATRSASIPIPERRVLGDRQSYALSGEQYTDIGVPHREYSFDFVNVPDSLKASVEAMFVSVGNHTPIVLTNFDDEASWTLIEPVYALLIAPVVGFSWLGSKRWSFDLSIREVA